MTAQDKQNATKHKLDKQIAGFEEALDKCEGRLRALFDNNHAVMLLINPSNGSIIDANAAAISFYGYSAKALLGMTISDINTLPCDEVAKKMRAAKEGQCDHFLFKHRLASGEVRDVEVFSGPISTNDTELLYSIIHDVTDRRKTEEALQRYKMIIASSPDLVSLVDRTHHYRMVNNSYLEMFRKTADEIVDKYIPDLIGQNFFEDRVKPDLDKAFAGKTVSRENTLEVPGKGTRNLSVLYHPVEELDGSINFVAAVVRDITDQKQNELALKEYAERLSLATYAGKIGIWEYDINTGQIHWDDLMMKMYRIEPREFRGSYEEWCTRVHPDDLEDTEKRVAESIEKNQLFEYDFRIVWPDGQIRHIKAAALPRLENGQVKSMIGINWDETNTRQLEDELRRLATTDALTGAHNRRYFLERAIAEIARGRRYDTPVSLLSIDIDHFKEVNDTYGHPAGDEVLKTLVRVCHETLRISDVFARMGGEEFSAILPETDLKAARLSAERLRKAVAQTKSLVDDQIITHTISIGVSQIQGPEDSLDELMRRADTALYRAKDLGRDRVEST